MLLSRNVVVTWLWAIFLVFYPVTLMAAENVFRDTTGFSVAQASYAVIMGAWGALASYTQKLAENKVTGAWFPILVADLTNSTLAATVGFLFCVHWGVSPSLTGLVCTLSGYGGARFLSWAYHRFIEKAEKAVERS